MNSISMNMKNDTSKTNGYWRETQEASLNSGVTLTHFHELGHFIDNNIGKAIPFAQVNLQNYYITANFSDKVALIEKNTGQNVLEKDILNTLFTHANVTVTNRSEPDFSQPGQEISLKFSDIVKTDKNGEVKFSGASLKRLLDRKSENNYLGSPSGYLSKIDPNEPPDDINRKIDNNAKLLKSYGLDEKKYLNSKTVQEKNTLGFLSNLLLKKVRSIYTDGIEVNGTKYLTGDVQDITSGKVGISLGWGHAKSYMNQLTPAYSLGRNELHQVDGTEKEITAEFFEATVVGGKRLETIKLYYPETYKVWYEAFKETVDLAIKGQENAKGRQNDPTFKADAKYQNW
jgi:hypothetical protein